MTVQEANKICFGKPYIVPIEEHNEAKEVIKKALEEVEQYRALGTVEELKEAREKQVAKKLDIYKTPNTSFGKARTYYICPTCGVKMCCDWKFCFECGQALDWSEHNEFGRGNQHKKCIKDSE